VWIGFDTEYRVCAGLFSSIVSLEPALIGNETTKPESRARYALLKLEAGYKSPFQRHDNVIHLTRVKGGSMYDL
jgi:hypothetical protein